MAQPAPGDDAAPRFLFRDAADLETAVGRAINGDFLAEEEGVVRGLARAARFDEADAAEVHRVAVRLVEAVRAAPASKSGLDAFLRQYDLSSQEGVILMCLAEALLRIPDDETADRLIADKLKAGDWASHLGDSHSLFVNASTWGLMLTGRIVRLEPGDVAAPAGALARVVGRMGEPVVRTAMRQAMRIMGHQFVRAAASPRRSTTRSAATTVAIATHSTCSVKRPSRAPTPSGTSSPTAAPSRRCSPARASIRMPPRGRASR